MELVSYAQNLEDVILWRVLGHVQNGFYIDIGAQDPIVDSVSLAFHQRCWRGIHIEPIPYYAELLRQNRPGDLVIQAAVGSVSGLIEFFEAPNTGISTGSARIAELQSEKGHSFQKLFVPCITLREVFQAVGQREVHWLKIDVEGLEKEVLSGWADDETRPWIVLLESTIPGTEIESHLEWEILLLEKEYTFAYFDGLNRFYVSNNCNSLLKKFGPGPNVFDRFTLSGTTSASFVEHVRERERESTAVLSRELSSEISESVNRFKELKNDVIRIESKCREIDDEFRAKIEKTISELIAIRACQAEYVEIEAANEAHTESITNDLLQLQAEMEAKLLQLNETNQRNLAEQSVRLTAIIERERQRESESRRRELDEIKARHAEEIGILETYNQSVSTLRAYVDNQISIVQRQRMEFENVQTALAREAKIDADKRENILSEAIREVNRKYIQNSADIDTHSERIFSKLQQNREAAHRETEDLTSRLRGQELVVAEWIEATNRLLTESKNEITERVTQTAKRLDIHEQKLGAIEGLEADHAAVAEIRITGAEQAISKVADGLKSVTHALQQRDADSQKLRELFTSNVEASSKSLVDLQSQVATLCADARRQSDTLATVSSDVRQIKQSLYYRVLRLLGLAGAGDKPPNHKSHTDVLQPSLVALTQPDVSDVAEQILTVKHFLKGGDLVVELPRNFRDLVLRQDREFVEVCYRALLGRLPDPDGFKFYLNRVRSGVSRRQISAEIALSAEGIAYNSKLPGLQEQLKQYRKSRMPVIGVLLGLLQGQKWLQTELEDSRALQGQLALTVEKQNAELVRLESNYISMQAIVEMQKTSSIASEITTEMKSVPTVKPTGKGFQRSISEYQILDELKIAIAREQVREGNN